MDRPRKTNNTTYFAFADIDVVARSNRSSKQEEEGKTCLEMNMMPEDKEHSDQLGEIYQIQQIAHATFSSRILIVDTRSPETR
jgi:hypothetical protein